jgi:nitrate reductase NapAB chaperone NapD
MMKWQLCSVLVLEKRKVMERVKKELVNADNVKVVFHGGM